jgi:multiple sugar transport system substrate-binding protein
MAYRTQFFSGKAAMVPMGAWMISDIQLLEKYPHTFKTTFAPWPRWDTTCKPNTSQLDGAGMGWTINANSEVKDQAYKFLRALTTDGLAIAGNTWTAWKKADLQTTLKGIAGGDEKLYDMKALKSILFDPERVDNIYQTVGPAQSEISEGPWAEEAEKYLVGGQSLDVTISNIEKKAEELIAKASK